VSEDPGVAVFVPHHRRLHALASRWLRRMRTGKLCADRLPPDTFEPWDTFFRRARLAA